MVSKNIVLVHGWGSKTEKLEPLGSELKKLGWNVINIRLPGFDMPDPENVWGLAEYSTWVTTQIPKEWEKEGYVFFGHSFGGRLALKQSEEKRLGLEGIVLCAAGGLSAENSFKLGIFSAVSKIGKILTGDNGFLKKVIYKLAGAGDYNRANLKMKQVMKKVLDENMRSKLNNSQVKMLVLWGKADRVVPYSGAVDAARTVGDRATLKLYEGEGHQLPYNLPEDIAKEIDKWWIS